MTLIDRDMALDLIGLYEAAFVRVHVLEQVLDEAKVEWRSRIEALQKAHADQVHDMFQEMRQLVLQADDVSSAVGKMLEKLEEPHEGDTER